MIVKDKASIPTEFIVCAEYEILLPGAIVKVYFSIVHFQLKRSNKNFFTAITHRVNILPPPSHEHHFSFET